MKNCPLKCSLSKALYNLPKDCEQFQQNMQEEIHQHLNIVNKALEKKKAMECEIEALQSHVDERARTKRNRGLILTGLVVEQCFFNSDFNKIQKINRDWWVKQSAYLSERDKAAYLEFLGALP